jgi:GNAT superfamily N-acetyltransferase
MPLDFSIRPGLQPDAENLSALAIQVFLHTYATEGISSPISSFVFAEFSAERLLVLLKNTTTKVFVAEANANLIGYARVDFGNPCPHRVACTAELATLYVQEHFTRKGVGSALLSRMEALAMKCTSNPLWLTVNAKNARAITFYARHGYPTIGVSQFRLGSEDHENNVLVAKAA